jgi:membrane-bound serine protease (ClpP class)
MKRYVFVSMILISLLAAAPVYSASQDQPVVVLEVEGVINTFSAQYLARGINEAQSRDAQLVVIVLDTPGGLETAMRDMVQLLMSAPMPTAVFVYPDGARATSAGMFILLAGDVAAMSPATHVGAAHPVPMGEEVGEVMESKMTEDAAALIRGIAEKRSRNIEWAQQAVRDNLAVTASEALEIGVIDLIAADLGDLLGQLDRREINGTDLNLVNAPLETFRMNFTERFFHIITEPNIAYLLLSLGTLLLMAEIADPGLSVAGIGAVISFIIAFLAFGSLPVNWAGIGLLAVAMVFFLVGLLTDTEFIVSIVGLVPFVMGSLLLFSPFSVTSSAAPEVRVSPWLIAVMGLSILGFSFFVLRAVLVAIRRPPQSGAQKLIGMEGLALKDLNPSGQVRVGLENWSAVALEENILKGALVRVKGVAGVRLQVELLKETSKKNNGATEV